MIFDLIRAMRPKSWLIVAIHFLIGYFLALPPAGMLGWGLLGALVWAILWNGGCLAFNLYFDRDIESISLLKNPPKVTHSLLWFSIGLLLAGQLLSLFFNPIFALIYFLLFAFSIAYSAPPIRLKSRFGSDLITSALSYGFLTLLAGWSISGRPLTMTILIVALITFLMYAAGYPLTQIPDFQEDKRRKDKGFSITLGKQRALYFAVIIGTLDFCLFFASILYGYLKPLTLIALVPPFFIANMIVVWMLDNNRISLSQIRDFAYILGPVPVDLLLLFSQLFG